MTSGRRDEEEERLGRMGGNTLGPGGNCVCPECGYTFAHRTGVPCYQQVCPSCGAMMTRYE